METHISEWYMHSLTELGILTKNFSAVDQLMLRDAVSTWLLKKLQLCNVCRLVEEGSSHVYASVLTIGFTNLYIIIHTIKVLTMWTFVLEFILLKSKLENSNAYCNEDLWAQLLGFVLTYTCNLKGHGFNYCISNLIIYGFRSGVWLQPLWEWQRLFQLCELLPLGKKAFYCYVFKFDLNTYCHSYITKPLLNYFSCIFFTEKKTLTSV